MPRRIPDYPDAYTGWNLISSYGSLISVFSTIVFLYILYDQLTKVESPLSNDYWYYPQFFSSSSPNPTDLTIASSNLEWTLSTPTPLHYLYETPKVTSINDSNTPLTNGIKNTSMSLTSQLIIGLKRGWNAPSLPPKMDNLYSNLFVRGMNT
ncbi:cytochrome c oxidase subunit 1 [Smittium mucronatum]|uniref:Cytochrome c oxidase subunit 1 n=1 Tax=Smittium mucronatum TaxID=133383 RepID=A0A1R0GKX0_9FUNG|nr:cytochrome c oxidase subunit 1 [Smittium mucronatum]